MCVCVFNLFDRCIFSLPVVRDRCKPWTQSKNFEKYGKTVSISLLFSLAVSVY